MHYLGEIRDLEVELIDAATAHLLRAYLVAVCASEIRITSCTRRQTVAQVVVHREAGTQHPLAGPRAPCTVDAWMASEHCAQGLPSMGERQRRDEGLVNFIPGIPGFDLNSGSSGWLLGSFAKQGLPRQVHRAQQDPDRTPKVSDDETP